MNEAHKAAVRSHTLTTARFLDRWFLYCAGLVPHGTCKRTTILLLSADVTVHEDMKEGNLRCALLP